MSPRCRCQQGGLTLLELLIVTLIVSMLVTLAVPGYRDYAARSQRTDARATLLRIASDQEAYFIRAGTYARSLQLLGFGSAHAPTRNGRYRLAVVSADTDHFTVRATYLGTDAELRRCAWFEIDEQLTRRSSPAGPAECWDR